MSQATLELALRKQRLQIAGESLRAEFGHHAAGLRPAFLGADMAATAADWVRRNPQPVVAVAVALLVVRPRKTLAWARGAFIGWRLWRDFRNFLDQRLPPLH